MSDTIIKETILLAKINALMDMQIHVIEQRKKLEEELKKYESKKEDK